MFHRLALLVALGAVMIAPEPAAARLLCTIVAEPGGKVLVEAGDGCGERVTPASTFKLPLAVMGFDAGFLKSASEPLLPFREGYPDWIAAWRQPTGPAGWMRNSVVWYSQRVTERLGADRLTAYARGFGYGNADFAGDPGKDNGLERAWIGSSLRISPREQVDFLGRLVERRLAVAPAAMDGALALLERHDRAGWTIRGKTGSAFPRRKDGSLDRARGWGWYVGLAESDGRRLVFATLHQDQRRESGPGGLRARAAFLKEWPEIVERVLAR